MNKILSWYIKIFTKIGQLSKKIINKNKILYRSSISDWTAKHYKRAALKFTALIVLIGLQLFIAAILLISYIFCKLTGICLLI